MAVLDRTDEGLTHTGLAQEDGRSLAHWLERLIEAEAARLDGKN